MVRRWPSLAAVSLLILTSAACSRDTPKRGIARPGQVISVLSDRTAGIGKLKWPIDVALGQEGLLYVLDGCEGETPAAPSCVYGVPITGEVRTLLGPKVPWVGNPVTSLPAVRSMAPGPDGTMYFSDHVQSLITAILPNRERVHIEGPKDGRSALDRREEFLVLPNDVLVDPRDGSLIASESSTIRRWERSGKLSLIAGRFELGGSDADGIPAKEAKIRPSSIALDPRTGDIFFTESGGGIRKIGADGRIMTVVDEMEIGPPGGSDKAEVPQLGNKLALDLRNGDLYVADPPRHQILRIRDGHIEPIAGDGSNRISGLGGSALKAGIGTPAGITIDASGNLYVSVSEPPRVLMVGATGSQGR